MKKILIFLAFVPNFLFGQLNTVGLPFVTNYTSDEYKAYDQNLSAIQDKDGIMYFANTAGLLIFDGKNWDLLTMPENQAVRDIAVSENNKIYLCGNDLLGYLEPDSVGNLQFISILDKIPEKFREKNHYFKHIEVKHDTLYALMRNALFIYNENILKTIELDKGLNYFYLSNDNSLYIYGNNKIELYKNNKKDSIIFDNRIIKILERNDTIYQITKENDVYYLNNDNNLVWSHKLNLSDMILYGMKQYKNDYLILYTQSLGAILVDFYGNIICKFDSQKGLLSDIVYNAYIDKYNNFWFTTNKGISYVEYGMPLRLIDERSGFDNGIPMFLSLYNNELYTNTGNNLYKINLKKGFRSHLEKIENVRGQMWGGITIGEDYFISSSRNILKLDKNGKTKLYGPNDCIWNITKIPDTENDYLLGGIANIYHYKYNGDSLKYQKTLKNFTNYARRIYFEDKNTFWVSGRVEGIYKVKLTDSITVKSTKLYNKDNGLNISSSLRFIKWRDKLLLSTFGMLYYYDQETDSIKEFEAITNKFDITTKKTLQLIAIDSNNVFWFEYYNDNHDLEIFCFIYQESDNSFVETNIFVKKLLNFGIYTIFSNTKEQTIVATTKGLVFVDNTNNYSTNDNYKAYIKSIHTIKNDSLLYGGTMLKDNGGIKRTFSKKYNLKVEYSNNDLRFEFVSPRYMRPNHVQYRVKMLNFDDKWSNWSYENIRSYSNLSPGKYTFMVEAQDIFYNKSEVSAINIYIKYPWYRSIWAYIGYSLLFILFLYLLIIFFTHRLKVRNEKLENLVQERTAEISYKNLELQQRNEEIEAQRDELEEQKGEIETQKEIIEKQQEETELQRDIAVQHSKAIDSSIRYAYRIQKAVLPAIQPLQNNFSDYFIFFKPRDVVSGDFYWVTEKSDKTVIVAADCTGHGVPGAFMSILGISFLNQIVTKEKNLSSSAILNTLRAMIIKALKQSITSKSSNDGIDLALVIFDNQSKQIQYSGAYNSLYIISDNKPGLETNTNILIEFNIDNTKKTLYEVKADRMPIGVFIKEMPEFSEKTIQLNPNDMFYMFSDGYLDLFNKERNLKFTAKRFKTLLLENSELDMKEQYTKIQDCYIDWCGGYKQIDDIIVIGVLV